MFSVVIPIYNHARYLRRAVASALASPLVREILLVDDGSSDHSPALASEFALAHPGRVRDLSDSPPTNKGAHVRLNELCRAATQPWIAVLNSDDIFAPHRFETAALLIRAKRCEFIAGGILIIDQDGQPIGRKRGIADAEFETGLFADLDGALDSDQLAAVLCNQNILATTSNMLFSRSLFDRIGGFADLRYSHDWDFALRATQMGRCLWTPTPLTLYRIHASNTIKEITPHLDGEVVRFFYRLLHDFPGLESDTLRLKALQANRYLKPYVGLANSARSRPAITPPSPASALDTSLVRRLASAALSLAWFDHGYLLIADSLCEPPASEGMRLITPEHLRYLCDGPVEATAKSTLPAGAGRLLRLPGPLCAEADSLLPRLKTSEIDEALSRLASNSVMRPRPDEKLLDLFQALITPRSGNKPRCLIFPAFFAVGGVERNTVEIIRELREDYDFLVVSTERHSKSQGSLAYQLDELGVPSLDLAEVANRERHLELIATIKSEFSPDLVWICNGSPWLVENAPHLRRLFASAPIVDQQVYDVEQGWIAHYHRSGIQASDRFIAINRRIYEKFVHTLRIPRHRVHLIYSAVSPERIVASRLTAEQRLSARRQLGVSEKARHLFAFVARLNPQKRPLRFLEIARRALAADSPDVFIMVGGGELEAECAEFANRHQLTNLIRIPYSPNTPGLLASVDALVMTSAFEGLPIVLIESLGVGTPAFCTDAGDIGDLLGETRAGIAVPSKMDEPEVWMEFLRFSREINIFRTNAIATRDDVLARFSSNLIAKQYRECFSEAIRESRSHSAAIQ